MPQNSSLSLLELDFETLKESFKSYMLEQENFRDYDFDGSNMNVLIDLLTYNTFKGNFYTNMLFAESFLDSAQLRDSVLSHAKELNYTPRSARSTKANITMTFQATGENQPYIIPKGSSFSTLVKNESYIFSIDENITVASSNTTFTFTSDIYEGIYLQDSYIFPATLENQRFRITNKNVDTTSLVVTVFEDNALIGDQYTLTQTLLDVGADDKKYFLQASENGYFEIFFGDGVIGKQPKLGSTIVLDYRISNGPKPDGAKVFVTNFDPTGIYGELSSSPRITLNTAGEDGADAESISSIKYYAPRHFQIQERAVIPTDYSIALQQAFPEINAVSAYGGEDHIPPMFGKVFIAIDIADVEGLPKSKVDAYTDFIRRRTMLDPVFIEPTFTYLSIYSKIRYNVNVTTMSKETIRSLVTNTIETFNEDNLNDFGVQFRYSPFVTEIDDTDNSIISNVTNVIMYKKLNPVTESLNNFVLNFTVELSDSLPNEISRNTSDIRAITSSFFVYNGVQCFLEDDGEGRIYVVRFDELSNTRIAEVGSVDYRLGTVQINNLLFDSYEGNYFKIYASSKDKDIEVRNDTIMSIESDEIHLTIEQLRN